MADKKQTIAERAERILSEGKAKNKTESVLMARKELHDEQAKEAERQLKIIENAKKKVEREKARDKQTQQKIILGGLFFKAGLEKIDAETLFGALLAVKDGLQDPARAKAWETAGAEAWAKVKPSSHEPDAKARLLAVKFPGGKPDDELLKAMKATGRWKWIGEAKKWEGMADPDEVRKIVEVVGAVVEVRQ